ncbi:dephospho-CoA kinase [Microcoleus sp. FACHB-1515]|uniref:dephospho-CoA kinase n=1 Tax=Cyanophyceae TaxID=3028117 RepID=UPI001687C4EF|nr:dephospho-CoA kinase [Microcoleus sp. FACHB-1515]MBD2089767.1 dephospho-CoA kinase [Microcoleus sp. FACHB-1515]
MVNRFPPDPLRRIIGLTGGVGMGKTTISNYLATAYNLPILDADIFAREAVAPHSPILAEIVERYGASILQPDRSLDRARLAQVIFSSSAERLWVEQQIHPFVRDRFVCKLKSLAAEGKPVAVLVVPLLFEARMTDLVTEIWVVRSTPQQQIARLQERDQLDLSQIIARIDSQMPIEKKLDRADVILDNRFTLEALFEQVDRAIVADR